MATHSSVLVWRIPWSEEPGATVHRLTNSRHTEATERTQVGSISISILQIIKWDMEELSSVPVNTWVQGWGWLVSPATWLIVD